MRTRLRSVLFLFLATSLLVGCSGDSPVAPQEQMVAGTYTLQSVAEFDLPVVVHEDGALTVNLIEGTVLLDANGTFAETLVFSERNGTSGEELVTWDLAGTYSVEGATITFTSPQEVWAGTISNGTLSYQIGNATFVFRL